MKCRLRKKAIFEIVQVSIALPNRAINKHTKHYLFGMMMQERSYTATAKGYRFGFNGKESDDEVAGEGNSYDYGFRIYNPQIGKFLSVDPLTSSYPWYTPYQFAGNKPIIAIDLDGLEEWVVSDAFNEPKYMGKMWDIINSSDVLKSQYASVTLASRYETHKIYSVIIPKSSSYYDGQGFTLDGDNISGACQLILNPRTEGEEKNFYIELFKVNGLDAQKILEEGLDKELNLVAIKEDLFDKDEYGGFATETMIHEIVAHIKNNMNGIDKTEEQEHYEYFKESDKTDEENEIYRSGFSPSNYKLTEANSIAGTLWREVVGYMLKKDAEKTPTESSGTDSSTTDKH